MIKVEWTDKPNSNDIDFLTQKIIDETPEFGSAYSFAFFVRNDNNEIIAGCNGPIVYEEIYTDQLWVHPSHRKQGLAKKLMINVHKHGLEKGCRLATVSTMNFQNAIVFYQKLGYEIDYERKSYVNGSKLFLSKKL